MTANYLFRRYQADDYIAIAQEAEKWIRTNEIETPYGIRWKQSPDSSEDFSDYPMLTEKALYGGSAGIGLFYLRLYQAVHNEAYLDKAEKAADYIIHTDEGPDFYRKALSHASGEADKLVHVKNMPGWIIGYYNGPTGSANLILKLYEATGKEKYRDYAVKVVDDLLQNAVKEEEGLRWSE